MMNKTKLSTWVLLALSATAFSVSAESPDQPVALSAAPAASCVQFSEGWASLPLADGVASAGYGRLQNTCEHAVTVVSASSADFAKVSLHQTSQVEDVSQMRDTEALTLEGGQTLEFSPGGLHLMLADPSNPLEEGQSVALELTLVDGSAVAAELQVRALDNIGGDEHDDHEH